VNLSPVSLHQPKACCSKMLSFGYFRLIATGNFNFDAWGVTGKDSKLFLQMPLYSLQKFSSVLSSSLNEGTFCPSSLASTVVQGNVKRAICISNGKPHILTRASTKTNHPIEMKVCTVYYVRELNKCANFHRATYRGSAPTNTWNITFISFFSFF
jgi:hypothetical protein